MTPTNKDQLYFIVNPTAGGGIVGKKWADLKARLTSNQIDFTAHLTSRPLEATEVTRKALASGYEHFIAVGGDGTNHEIINGLFNDEGTIPESVTLGFFPAGSGNDFLRFLEVPNGFEKAIERLSSDRRLKIDIGKMTFKRDGRDASEYLISVAGTGFTADVTKTANDHFKFLGKHCYVGAFFPNLLGFDNVPLKISIDGKVYERKSCMTVVANTGFFGGGMHIAPNASVQDGLFEVLLFREFGRIELATNFLKVFKGTHIHHPKIEVYQGKEISISSEQTQNILADGEIIGITPVHFECLPQALTVRL